MKYCSNCGGMMQDDAQFCPLCGTISSAPAPAPIPTPVVVPTAAPVAKPKKARKPRKGKYGFAWTAVIAVYLILAIVVSCSFGLFDGVIGLFDFGSGSSLRDKDRDNNNRKPGNTSPEDPEDPYDPIPEDPAPEDPTPEIPEEPEVPEYTIRVWAPGEGQYYGNSWLEQMQQRFEDDHPEYNIVWDNSVYGEGDAGDSVICDASSAADVYMFANDQLHKIVKAGGLSKLVGKFRNQVLNDNNELMVNSVTYTDGSQYAFPISNNTWVLYYDKTVFTEEDVQNLDTMLEKGRVHLPLANAWTGGCFFLGAGGTLFGENGLDADAGINFGGENGYKAVRKMVELKNNPNVVMGNLDVSGMLSGDVSATFNGSWVYGTLEAALGENLGVAMLPKFTIDDEEYQMTAMSGSKCVGVNPYAGYTEGKLEVCLEFAAFLASEEAQLARYEIRGVIPAHQVLRYHWMIQDDPLAVAEMDTIAYASVLESALSEMDNYWSPMGSFCYKLCRDEITLDNYELAFEELLYFFEDSYW